VSLVENENGVVKFGNVSAVKVDFTFSLGHEVCVIFPVIASVSGLRRWSGGSGRNTTERAQETLIRLAAFVFC
jgi:hypothetical protein